MFREMRRKKQILSREEDVKILKRGTSGTLALIGDEDYPYAVPISYVYENNKIYFHGAKTGHKIDAIAKNKKASFCVIDEDKIVPDEFTTYFRSVIIFGKIRILKDENEIRNVIQKIADKYSTDAEKSTRDKEIEREWKILCVLEMSIEHMTGKEAIEFVKNKNKVKELNPNE